MYTFTKVLAATTVLGLPFGFVLTLLGAALTIGWVAVLGGALLGVGMVALVVLMISDIWEG